MLERVEQAVSELPVPSSVVELQPRRGDEQHEDQHPDQPFRSAEEPRKGFMLRHRFALGIALLLFLVAAPTTYLYWDYARHFEIDRRCLHRGAPVRHRPQGVRLHHRRTGHRQPACRRRRRDRAHRRSRLPHRARAGARRRWPALKPTSRTSMRRSTFSRRRSAPARPRSTRRRQRWCSRSSRRRAIRTWRKRRWAPFRTPSSTRRNCISSRRQLASAQANSQVAQRQVEALKAQRSSAVASLAQAKAQRDQAQLNLSYTTVTAAQPGRVVDLSCGSRSIRPAGHEPDHVRAGRDLGRRRTSRRRSSTPCGPASR